jgi:DedD protein
MASPTSSPEASEIRRRGRRRLIGAVAIAVLLVVFVPMILDSEPRPARNQPTLEIPAKENAPALPPPAPAKIPAAPAAELAPAQSVAPPVKATPAPAAPVEPAPAAAPKLEGFAVQVGAFKDEDKLKQAAAKLAAAGIKHYIERRDAQSGGLTRLRAGPFPTREAAEKALAGVKAASLDGQVVALP